MKFKLRIGSINSRCSECGKSTDGRQIVDVWPDNKSSQYSRWILDAPCFMEFAASPLAQESKGFDKVREAMEDALREEE